MWLFFLLSIPPKASFLLCLHSSKPTCLCLLGLLYTVCWLLYVDDVLTYTCDPDSIVLVGDFNLPYEVCNDIADSNLTTSSSLLQNLATIHNLKQVNAISKFIRALLDLMFSSIPDCTVIIAGNLLMAEDRHYPALFILLCLPKGDTQ